MSSTGLFITVEGGEGVGKSTNMAFLEGYLRGQGVDLVVTREPGGTRLGEDIREMLLQVRDEGQLERCILDRTCERSCPTGAISILEVPEQENDAHS